MSGIFYFSFCLFSVTKSIMNQRSKRTTRTSLFPQEKYPSPFCLLVWVQREEEIQTSKKHGVNKMVADLAKPIYPKLCAVCCRHRRNICGLGLCSDESRTSFSPGNILALKRIQKFRISLSSTCLLLFLFCICSLLFLFPTSFSHRP